MMEGKVEDKERTSMDWNPNAHTTPGLNRTRANWSRQQSAGGEVEPQSNLFPLDLFVPC